MDKTLWTLLLIAILSSTSGKPSFVFTGPKVYDVGTKETVALNLFDVTGNGKVYIRFYHQKNELDEVALDIENGQGKTFELPVPRVPNGVTEGSLGITGFIGNYKFSNLSVIYFRNPKPIVFVSTDKPLYKAGQTVKIRVLATDRNLKPPKEMKEGDIWITDPNRIRIVQWLNVSFSIGLIHRELLLPEEPLLGRWTVYVKTDNDQHYRHFDVQEYVLPPFEVTITPPPYVLKKAKNITWEVCARYTYGKPVRGELIAQFSNSRYWGHHRRVITRRIDLEGCEEVTFYVSELGDFDDRYGYYNTDEFQLFAEVEEEGTGTKMNATNNVYTNSYAYTIKRRGNDISFFKPRIPLKITMELRTPDSKPLPDELISVCMKTKREKWSDIRSITDNLRTCKNYTSNQHGYVIFTIPPQDPNTVSLEIEVEAAERHRHAVNGMQLPKDSFLLQPWYSASGSYLQIQKLNRIDCSAFDPDVKVTHVFHYTFNQPGTKKIYYQIMARGEVVDIGDFDIGLHANGDDDSTDDTYLPYYSSEFCLDDKFEWGDQMNYTRHVGKFIFSLKMNPVMIPKVRLLLYTVNDDGEVVADSTWSDVDPCFANKVDMTFGEEKQSPGSKASIHLTAEPQSYCSIGAVDKSVFILNKGDRLTGEKVSSRLHHLDTSRYTYPQQVTSDYNYCSGGSTSRHVDAITAFALGGGLVLTDLKLETRPCKKSELDRCYYPGPPYNPSPEAYGRQPVPISGHSSFQPQPASLDLDVRGRPGAGNAVLQPSPTVTVRTDFPETWLFDLHTVGDDGTLTIHEDIPDSITEWQGEAVCIHSDKGLGLSKPSSIVAFQPFFASLTLPYSVIRNEIAPITVSVFNYLEDCLSIRIHLDDTEEFDLFNGTLTKDVCVCGGQSATERFHIKPKVLGQMNVTVMAATSKNTNVCSDVSIATDVKRSDTIIKPIIVEAEGFLKEETKNTFFCMEDVKEDSFNAEYKIQVPVDAVEDSARAYCLFTGDIMGPTLEGLDNLIRLPTGCGEQNMIGLVPNIVVLDYLNSTERLTGELEQKAVNHIKQGYIRQQKYRHADGSYSAFGNNDAEGSMWLTAFVVRTFSSARRHITIDEQSLKYSRNWILSRQRSNGCFPMVGTVHHKEMKGGVGRDDGTTSTLTAYILIAMLESGHLEDAKIESGFRCLEAMHDPSNYSLALFAYAAVLAHHPSAFTYLDKLMNNAEREGHYLYWNSVATSISVETAGYAILTLLRANREGDFSNAAALARWLTNRRNSYGGFYSTQDTVVALQALGEYGARVTRQQLDMQLSIKSDKVQQTYPLNEENELITEKVNLKIEQPKTDFHVEATGTGCALVQTLLRYNLPIPEPSKDFELSVKSQKSAENCKMAEIEICTSYNHPGGSNMAIIEAKMVSGYVPIKNTVQALLQRTELGIRRYEIEENAVNIYFTTLTEEKKCFSFQVKQDIEVLEAKPANVKVYDYYDNEKAVSSSYSIGEECA